jgi:hypothetical protein
MKPITLSKEQLSRLLNAIQEFDLDLYNKVKTNANRYYRFYANFDGLTSYTLGFTDVNYKPTAIYYISWDSIDIIHDYIMNDSSRVSSCD